MRSQDIQDEMLDEAVAWVVRLRAEPSAEDLEQFHAWRTQSALHERAYREAAGAWAAVGEHATSSQLLGMRRDALDRARRRSRWWERRSVIAAAFLLLVLPAVGISWYQWRTQVDLEYQTARGEQRMIVLPDGSRLSLDAMSRVAVNFTPDVRGITLMAGRASFEVVKDVARPLKVRAGPRTVTAIGTVFTVERESREVRVSLVEGRVAVTSEGRPTKAVEMHPRQQLRMTDSGDMTSRDELDTAQMLAWRDGKLVFDNELLADVAARVNNYAATRVEVEGKARDLRISGVFKAGDTGAFVDAMENDFDLKAVHREDAIALQLE